MIRLPATSRLERTKTMTPPRAFLFSMSAGLAVLFAGHDVIGRIADKAPLAAQAPLPPADHLVAA